MDAKDRFVKSRMNTPQLALKKSVDGDKRISVCSACKWGIFPKHKYVWTSRGLVHDPCENKAVTV